MGLKMSSHANPGIRQMGIRRLMGASMTLYGIGKGVSETAYYLTGTTEAQWDMVQPNAMQTSMPMDQGPQESQEMPEELQNIDYTYIPCFEDSIDNILGFLTINKKADFYG